MYVYPQIYFSNHRTLVALPIDPCALINDFNANFVSGCYFNSWVDWSWVCKTNTLGWEQCDVIEKEKNSGKGKNFYDYDFEPQPEQKIVAFNPIPSSIEEIQSLVNQQNNS